jgi:hypothetical protein
LLSQDIHRRIYLFGLCALAFGMMVGTVPTSVPQILLMGNWLLEGDCRRKWFQLKANGIFWVLSSVYLAHVLGLLHSGDLPAAGHDIRTKMPLMFLPLLIFSSRALSQKEIRLILHFFLYGCLANTAWCFVYSFILHPGDELRSVSRFMSHIRFGMYLNMAIATSVYFALTSASTKRRMAYIAGCIWFLSSMYLLGLFSGLLNFFLLAAGLAVVLLFRQGGWTRYAGVPLLLLLPGIPVLYLRGVAHEQLDVKPEAVNVPREKNEAGNLLLHFDTSGQKENGYYVLMNVQPDELQRQWKSDFPADSFSYATGHNLARYEVLVRYMASKGLFRDSAGYGSLSARDKENIRHGMTNYKMTGWSMLRKRAYELVNEYDEFRGNRHVSGHSLSMRMYFWKAALLNIRERPVAGAGTGDVQQVMNEKYTEYKMPLDEQWYKRPHNQYLTIGVALGIPGLLLFAFSLAYPPVALRRTLHVLYWPFLLLALVSFVFEDTLETQAGLTFYAFFNTLLIAASYPFAMPKPEAT